MTDTPPEKLPNEAMIEAVARALFELEPCPICAEQPKLAMRGMSAGYQCRGKTHLLWAYGSNAFEAAENWNRREHLSTTIAEKDAAMSRASHKADEGVVEAAAKALQQQDRKLGHQIVGWDSIGPQTQAHYRFRARAAINAAYPLLITENMRLREAATNARFALEFYEREIVAMVRFGNISKHALERCRERGQEEITRIAALTRDSGIGKSQNDEARNRHIAGLEGDD